MKAESSADLWAQKMVADWAGWKALTRAVSWVHMRAAQMAERLAMKLVEVRAA